MGIYERIKEVSGARGYSINRLEKELGLPHFCHVNSFKQVTPKVPETQ